MTAKLSPTMQEVLDAIRSAGYGFVRYFGAVHCGTSFAAYGNGEGEMVFVGRGPKAVTVEALAKRGFLREVNRFRVDATSSGAQAGILYELVSAPRVPQEDTHE